ncbi:MAG: hypothetical protein KKG84_05670 [Candidatus Omnitrophica bacterium]|nr:hypothetical protein [Candidatus Omnitrophota bacterium]
MEKKKKTEILYEKKDLEAIAKNQKLIIWFFISLSFVLILGGIVKIPELNVVFTVAQIAVFVPLLVQVFKIARNLKEKNDIIYAVALFLPIISLVVIAYLLSRSTKVLRAHGMKVGLLGAKE